MDKTRKIAIIESGFVDTFDLARKMIFLYDDFEAMKWLQKNFDDFDGLRLVSRSRRARTRRLKEKIYSAVKDGKAVFLTLTFRDDVLLSTSPETRRRYVSRVLKSQCSLYVANIDFSPVEQREHYHAVVVPVSSRFEPSAWSYGFSWCERIRNRDCDVARTARYTGKLTSHAVKVDFKRVIYSRNT